METFCKVSAFAISAAFYECAREDLKNGREPLIGDQSGEGWLSVIEAAQKLGEAIEQEACNRIEFNESAFCWPYWWEEAEHVRPIYENIPRDGILKPWESLVFMDYLFEILSEDFVIQPDIVAN